MFLLLKPMKECLDKTMKSIPIHQKEIELMTNIKIIKYRRKKEKYILQKEQIKVKNNEYSKYI